MATHLVETMARQVGMDLVEAVHLASQAGKYAGLNDDEAVAAHLLDLATEIGAALVKSRTGGAVVIPVGVLDELAGLGDTVADHVGRSPPARSCRET
ncbi:hypothetical protein [Streptomyces werraensis]|uniref:hypothetical protein n=1 Tax=Streptomyces werraensis TaxID=68284 RepID=UPI0037D0999B